VPCPPRHRQWVTLTTTPTADSEIPAVNVIVGDLGGVGEVVTPLLPSLARFLQIRENTGVNFAGLLRPSLGVLVHVVTLRNSLILTEILTPPPLESHCPVPTNLQELQSGSTHRGILAPPPESRRPVPANPHERRGQFLRSLACPKGLI
jgi:hypothetical protein